MNLSPGSSEHQEGAALPLSATPSPLLCLREETAALTTHVSACSAGETAPKRSFLPQNKAGTGWGLTGQ